MKHALLAGALIAAGFATSARADVVVVLGRGPAHDCYVAAANDRQDRNSIDLCDLALNHDFLTREDRAATLVNRGVLQMRRGGDARALSDFENAAALRPEFGEAHLMRGIALVELGRYQDAINALTHAINLDLDRPERAYFFRAAAQEELGNTRAAYSDYQRAAALAPSWNSASTELARFQVRRN